MQIVEINGQRYVKLLSNFRTNGGPQLELILDRNSTVSKSICSRDYVTLSALKKVNRSQLYRIPNNINLNNFESVAIWCRQFNVTFGYATI